MSSETSQSSLMDFTVPAVKKLPSSSSLEPHSTVVPSDCDSSNLDGANAPPAKKTALEVLLGNFFSENPVTSVTVTFTEIVMAEVSRYKYEPLLPLKMKISEWWRSHSPSYPNLSIIARKYLSIVATSVPSERLFSVAGNVVNAKRSSLEPENVEKLVFLHDNLPPVPLPYKRISNKSDMTEEPSEIEYNYSND